ncbi:uncharacterized protein FIBRA_05109 [Fibroporia radiculosa]|uniref:Uncharacterized protein n=1 Tax=Fibroporia radiculosa TaxID=599839 RepID=J4H3B7_9APHY|nr:uncharacterized protein FIBRA_05109 [Fibroporia radiculosa]CCM02994.1 predicted protein [Fibroporia radiculosa]
MQSLFRSAKSFRPLFLRPTPSLHRQGVESLESFQPLYERKPPWWTRWTYLLVGADLVVTFSACELTWNHWSRWEPLSEASKSPSPATVATNASALDADTKETKGHYALRPWWQRAPFAGGQFFLGVAVGVLILVSRSRVIRKLYILPPSNQSGALPSQGSSAVVSSHDRRVLIQSVHHFRNQGKLFPMQDCALERGHDDAEIILRINNVRGQHWFGLQNSTVNGQTLPVWQARDEIFKTWYGDEQGKKMRMEERWKSGPVLNKDT